MSVLADLERQEADRRRAMADGYGYGGGVAGEGLPGALNQEKKTRNIPREYFERYFTSINYDLMISKTFYFFFFAAFGSLFPLIAVYFKQLGMNPAQTGVLIGFRPFVEIIAGPFWGNIAQRWNKFKQILLFSLFCWVAFTLALAFIQPPADSCLVTNGTHIIIVSPWTLHGKTKRSTMELSSQDDMASFRGDLNIKSVTLDRYKRNDDDPVPKAPHPPKIQPKGPQEQDGVLSLAEGKKLRLLPHPSIEKYGMSPLPLDHKDVANLDEIDDRGLVSPPLSAVVYKTSDIHEIFFIILILMIIGEFASAPAIALADAATLGYLDNDVEKYGRQRMLGSFGWAISMFIVGIALDHSNIFPNHPCGTEQLVDRNYTVSFAVFSVLMVCAFLTATQFNFESVEHQKGRDQDTIQLSTFQGQAPGIQTTGVTESHKVSNRRMIDSEDESPYGYNQPGDRGTGTALPGQGSTLDAEKKMQISLQPGQSVEPGHGVTGDMISDAIVSDVGARPSPYVPRGKPGQVGTLPQWVSVLKLFANVKYGSMLFMLWWMGFGIGMVFAFLFWHLQDLQGTPTLFGVASVVNHLSEIMAYFYSRKLIGKVGHINVLYMGLGGNIIRFLYVSWVRKPWSILPFELLQGLTHAVVWAAGCSYVTQTVPAENRPTAQGILQSIHHGLGRGCGTIIGGIFVHYYGTEATFRGYGITCIVLLIGYFALNFFYIRKYAPDETESGQVMEEAHLAPHGVPMFISHSLSNSKLGENDKGGGQSGYGATKPNSGNGYLDPGNSQSGGYSQGRYSQGGYGGGTDGGRGGGGYGDKGIVSDPGYGYSIDAVGTNGKLNALSLKKKPPPIPPRKNRIRSDQEIIKQNFEEYEELTSQQDSPKLVTRALVMQDAPKPVTELFMQQPENAITGQTVDDWY